MMKGLFPEAVAASVSAGNGDGRRCSDDARGWWRCVLTSERPRLPTAAAKDLRLAAGWLAGMTPVVIASGAS